MPLFRKTGLALTEDFEAGIFQPYKNGWILPAVTLKPTNFYCFGTQFLQSFLTGVTILNEESEVCGYFFSTSHEVVADGAFILGFTPSKAGLARECHRIFSDENLVILEFKNCGTLALSPKVCDSLEHILESQ